MKKNREKVWKRLSVAEMERYNKKTFEAKKKEFDARYGEMFQRDIETKHLGIIHKEKSHAEWQEDGLTKLLQAFDERKLPELDYGTDWFGHTNIGSIIAAFLVPNEFFVPGYEISEEELRHREEEDFWEPMGFFADLKEIDLADRVRNLFRDVLVKASRLAYELKSNTYGAIRDLLIFYDTSYVPYRIETKEEYEEHRKELEELFKFKKLYQQLRLDLQFSGLGRSSSAEIGKWAKSFVRDYDEKVGYVNLACGKQRTYLVPARSAKAWEILKKLFASTNPEGWTKLPLNWKSNFVRKIGSSGEIDHESDLVKIAGLIQAHSPGKGRAGDGLYRFEPIKKFEIR